MAASATILSNNILVRARKSHSDITPMKLQKLLYYTCVRYAKETGKLPISERFEVWQYGPVVPSVYTEFKSFGSTPIKKFAVNADGKAQMVDESFNPVLQDCLDYVWDNFSCFSGVELSRRTHLKGSGWYSAFQRNGDYITTEEMKNDDTI